MQLGIWIVLCLVGAFVFRRHDRVTLSAAIVLWILVPAVGNATITGVSSGPLSIHVATWLVMSILAVQMVQNPRRLTAAVARHFLVLLFLAIVIVAGFVASRTSSAGGGMVLLADQIVAPVVFFVLLVAASYHDPGLVPTLRTLLLGLVALECCIAAAQWLSHNVLFYEAGFKTQYWFDPATRRWMGTLDQALALSLLICVTSPLVAGIKRKTVQALLLVLMAVGVLITQSRVGLLVLAFTLVFVVVSAKGRRWVKASILGVLAIAGAVMVSSPLVAGVLARIQDDTGSAEARALAIQYFLNHWGDYFIAGQGIGASYRVAVQGGLQTSFENPLIMYSIDIGIVFAVLYFGIMAFLVLRNAPRHRFRGLTLAGILAVAIPQTYSSLATRSAAGIIVWTILAMVAIAADSAVARRAGASESADPAKSRSSGADVLP